ncbi:MAG: hypothetical protein LBI31_00720 [Zoogloeaceae bacterium]|jgi:hypothetical protein|nr:hypothetical protein [Zoogloeaceae bacterium]
MRQSILSTLAISAFFAIGSVSAIAAPPVVRNARPVVRHAPVAYHKPYVGVSSVIVPYRPYAGISDFYGHGGPARGGAHVYHRPRDNTAAVVIGTAIGTAVGVLIVNQQSR